MNWTNAIRAVRGLAGAAAILVLASSAGPARAASPDDAPPLAAGQARVWFLRQLLPGTQLHSTVVYVNGAPFASSAAGTAFYRDFAPGQYRFDAENCVPRPETAQTVTLRPDSQLALEVTSDEDGNLYCTPPQVSYLQRVQLPRLPYLFAQVTYAGAR